MTAHSRSATLILFVIFSVILFSCKHKAADVERGFYYWKSDEYTFDNKEVDAIKILAVKKLYVRFFEVEYSKVFGVRPVSKALINFDSRLNGGTTPNVNIVPVVFIKNDVFINAKQEDLDSLANNILFLLRKRYREHADHDSNFSEIQIDCDWTASTKEKYFLLLKFLKNISGKMISCTLRMYPYKYPDLMGVPPVDKATLMCYNLNNPLENENKNSILDIDEIKKYLATKKQYPLHLDIVLPLNSWMLCFQNNQFAGILRNQDNISEIADLIKPLWYRVKKDTILSNIFLRVGDKIKYEDVSNEQLEKVARILKAQLKLKGTTTISFFHLDKTSLKKYSNATLDYLYNSFN
jgi:hypothetical protein